MTEPKVVSAEVQDSKLIVGVDTNKDGEKSIQLKINSPELLEELFAKGEAKIDVKTITLKMDLMKVKVAVDTDKDGEPVLEGEADLAEIFDEAKDAFSKKK